MSLFALIVFGVVLLLITMYIIVYVIYPGSSNKDVLQKMASLNVKRDILSSDQAQSKILGSAGSTVMGYFYLLDGNKTKNYTSTYIPLIQIENNWYLEISQSPNGVHSEARLRVQTNDKGTLQQEIIELPQIPKQKWMFIAILRDGRRFDVIYNNQIVASQILEYYPVIISSPLSVGNKGLSGSVIHVLVNGSRLSPMQVERERVTHVDTNNMVLEANTIDISFPGLKLFAQCPPGLPCDPITKPPSNNLLQWKSPYA